MTEFHPGRLHRAMALGQLGARLAAEHGRRLLRRDQKDAHAELAELLVEELGKMKGLPMKLGQILSYMAGFVPDAHEDVYRTALAQLRTTSPPVDQGAMEAGLREELGGSAEASFDAFDWTPIASASIGQVYAAELEGQRVCVKIQYPGIRRATENDLRNMGAAVELVRRLMPTIDAQQVLEDFRARLEEECDYIQEAEYQSRFAALYEDDPTLKVPRVISERSTARVLTSERLEGASLEAFTADADPADRTGAAEALFRFAFGTLLAHGLFHADPHPGNLLFRADAEGRLGVLDYGCVQPIGEDAR